MPEAGTAEGKAPLESTKPGEFLGSLPCITASSCGSETSDFKNYSMGVGKGVQMGAVYLDSLVRMGYGRKALAAVDKFFGVIFFFIDLVFDKKGWNIIPIFFRRYSEKKGAYAAEIFHVFS